MTPEEKLSWEIADQGYNLVYGEHGYAYSRPRFAQSWQIDGEIGDQKFIIRGETKLAIKITYLIGTFLFLSLIIPLLFVCKTTVKVVNYFKKR